MRDDLTPEECRERVVAARKLSAGANDATLRTVYDQLAEDYERLAQALEHQHKPKP